MAVRDFAPSSSLSEASFRSWTDRAANTLAALFACAGHRGRATVPGSAPLRTSPMRTCLLLALAVGALGVGARLALPVTPADDSFREVVRYYGAAQATASGNTRETSAP